MQRILFPFNPSLPPSRSRSGCSLFSFPSRPDAPLRFHHQPTPDRLVVASSELPPFPPSSESFQSEPKIHSLDTAAGGAPNERGAPLFPTSLLVDDRNPEEALVKNFKAVLVLAPKPSLRLGSYVPAAPLKRRDLQNATTMAAVTRLAYLANYVDPNTGATKKFVIRIDFKANAVEMVCHCGDCSVECARQRET